MFQEVSQEQERGKAQIQVLDASDSIGFEKLRSSFPYASIECRSSTSLSIVMMRSVRRGQYCRRRVKAWVWRYVREPRQKSSLVRGMVSVKSGGGVINRVVEKMT